MLGTTVSKVAVFVILVAASSGLTPGWDPSASGKPVAHDIPIALESTSLLVATLANGEIQTQWMPRDTCERIASSVAGGDGVAGVRSDGVKVDFVRANCSTRRLEVNPGAVALSTSKWRRSQER